MIAGVYCIKCESNGKIYIGQSNNIFNRWHSHMHNLLNNKHPCEEMQEDFNEYGYTNFSFSILETVEWDEKDKDSKEFQELLLYKESFHGQRLNADKIGTGYNSWFSHETRDYESIRICPEIEKIIADNRPKDKEDYIILYKLFLTSYQKAIEMVHITSFAKMGRVLGFSTNKVKNMVKNLTKYGVIKPKMAKLDEATKKDYPNGCRTTFYYIKRVEREFQKTQTKNELFS